MTHSWQCSCRIRAVEAVRSRWVPLTFYATFTQMCCSIRGKSIALLRNALQHQHQLSAVRVSRTYFSRQTRSNKMSASSKAKMVRSGLPVFPAGSRSFCGPRGQSLYRVHPVPELRERPCRKICAHAWLSRAAMRCTALVNTC